MITYQRWSIMMVCRKFIIILFIFNFIVGQDQSIAFVRFFLNEEDFLSGKKLEATLRHGKSYVQAFYNQSKLPIIKELVSSDGSILKREIMTYDAKGLLLRKFFTDVNSEPDSVIQYGENEAWSIEFRKSLNSNSVGFFDFQESKFILNKAKKFEKIIFSTVQGEIYGEIKFVYDHLGMLKGEQWIQYPEKSTVRKFLYFDDILSDRKEIKEYGINGQLISNIVLAKPIAEKLYKFPPPRFGNRLDEISIILEDIYQKDHKIPFDVFIPKTDHDLMVLTNNDSLLVELQDITNLEVKFKIIGQEGNLTMPINRVKNIMSKYGERIYP